MSAFIEALLAPRRMEDWLDRRAALEAEQRKAEADAYALEWLKKHHPRFSGGAS